MSLATAQPSRCPNPTAKAIELAYLSFERPALGEAERFLTDFGLHVTHRSADTLWFRNAGRSPFCHVVMKATKSRFAGLAFRVATRQELEALSCLPCASAIEPMEAPGGGERVQLSDPAGFVVDAVHGQSEVEPLPHRAPLRVNSPKTHSRVNDAQRPALAAPETTKLGHVVLEVPPFQDTCAWYAQHFGLIPSDVQVLPDGSPAVVFMRLDLGATPADHHTVAIVQGFASIFGHCAYEVVDADAVAMGQRWMRERGWRHAWGVGRHILGSQVFDYWNDPYGAKHEHYSDGDVFTADHPMGVHALSRAAMSQWGPVMPKSFISPELSVENLKALARTVGPNPDVTLKTLLRVLKAMG
ncbi:MAG: glyoxalase [Myxococcales bacterium]|nr:glyoxalase [Deltaproteobacteria bacterium]NNL23285.1 glyoxalase [Myxococcales bacterium]